MRLFCWHFSFLFAFLLSAASEDTRIIFPSFSAADENFMAFGDVAHSTANGSYIMNGGTRETSGTCGVLVYLKKVRIQDVATGRVASFNLSFSFTLTSPNLPWDNSSRPTDRSGFAFTFTSSAFFASMPHYVASVGHCSPYNTFRSDKNIILNRAGFILMFVKDYDPHYNYDPSNNYIRVGKNRHYEYDIPAYTHNLCGNDTHCSYFSNGKVFTTWIDFTSSSQTLQVWLATGSNSSVNKPLQPLLLIPNFQMPALLGDNLYPTFWGSYDPKLQEAQELLSWSLFVTEMPESSSIPESSQTPLHLWKARTWAGFTTGVMGMAVAAAVVIFWSISSRFPRLWRNRRYITLGHNAGPRVFSYRELKEATENFNERNLLGSGGSGSVYRGPNGAHFVAVKKINFAEPKQAESVFHAELSSLGQIRHRNVVQLHGWCQEKGRWLLVYDYMPNGGLNKWLYTRGRHDLQCQQDALSLKMRLSILEGVGAALEYLHEDCSSCILHRDIKSSNVLLDADFNAHLGDFGLARLMDHHKSDKTTLAAGTLGYMAPEIPYTGKASKESDVYGLGILMLEVVCGRHPLDLQAMEPEDLVLLHTVWRAHESGSLLSVVDPRLLQTLRPSRLVPVQDNEVAYAISPYFLDPENLVDSNIQSSTVVDVNVEVYNIMVVNILRLGLLCCLPNPKARPSMGQVNGILQQIRDMENACDISNIAMPFLPDTKPLGLYHSLEFSQTAVSITSSTPPLISSNTPSPASSITPSLVSLGHTNFLVNNSTLPQAFGGCHKDD